MAFKAKIDKLNSAQIHSSYGVKLSKKENLTKDKDIAIKTDLKKAKLKTEKK